MDSLFGAPFTSKQCHLSRVKNGFPFRVGCRADSHLATLDEEKCAGKKRARSLITVKYSHRERRLLAFPLGRILNTHSALSSILPSVLASFVWAARNCVLYDVNSTRNCSLSEMSCLHVGCYDRRVGASAYTTGTECSPSPWAKLHRPTHSSLITMLQLQINKVLIGRCCIHRRRRRRRCHRRRGARVYA